MTRPIPPQPFVVIAAPSCSRPQLLTGLVKSDALLTRNLMGDRGIAGFTEIVRVGPKRVIRQLFAGRLGVRKADSPLVWTGFEKVEGGVEIGSRGVPIVAPTRHTVWAILRDAQGLEYGALSTHMIPGARAAHPSRAQRVVRPLLVRRWNTHSRRIAARLAELNARCQGRVVMVGDINNPGNTTWQDMERVTGPGLLYIGLGPGLNHAGNTFYRHQHADHKLAMVTATPKGN